MPAAPGPAGAAVAAARAAASAAAPASSTPTTSAVPRASKRAARSASVDLPAEGGIGGGEDEARAAGERRRAARRAAEGADGPGLGALGHEGARQRPERRHEALGQHDDAGAARDLRRVLGHRARQRARRDREADDVLLRELELAGGDDAHARG